MLTEPRIGLCTVPDQDTASRIAEALVEQRLAACVNIIPAVQSVYRWQGKVQRDDEILLIFKTSEHVWHHIERVMLELHPYELPEIIAVPIQRGQADYLKWIHDSLI